MTLSWNLHVRPWTSTPQERRGITEFSHEVHGWQKIHGPATHTLWDIYSRGVCHVPFVLDGYLLTVIRSTYDLEIFRRPTFSGRRVQWSSFCNTESLGNQCVVGPSGWKGVEALNQRIKKFHNVLAGTIGLLDVLCILWVGYRATQP